MTIYGCTRCGETSGKKSVMTNHVKRKNICPERLADVVPSVVDATLLTASIQRDYQLRRDSELGHDEANNHSTTSPGASSSTASNITISGNANELYNNVNQVQNITINVNNTVISGPRRCSFPFQNTSHLTNDIKTNLVNETLTNGMKASVRNLFQSNLFYFNTSQPHNMNLRLFSDSDGRQVIQAWDRQTEWGEITEAMAIDKMLDEYGNIILNLPCGLKPQVTKKNIKTIDAFYKSQDHKKSPLDSELQRIMKEKLQEITEELKRYAHAPIIEMIQNLHNIKENARL